MPIISTLRGTWIDLNLFVDTNGVEHKVLAYRYIIDSFDEKELPQASYINCIQHSFGKAIVGYIFEKDLEHNSSQPKNSSPMDH